MTGIIVEEKSSGVRHAVSESNFNHKTQKRIRDLRPGETVLGYTPRRKGSLGDTGETHLSPAPAGDSGDDLGTTAETPDKTTNKKAEESAPADAKDQKRKD